MVKKQSIAHRLHPKSLSLTGTGLCACCNQCGKVPAVLLETRELPARSGHFSGLLKVIFPSPKLFAEGLAIVFSKDQLQEGGKEKKIKGHFSGDAVKFAAFLPSPTAPPLLPSPDPAAGDGASPFHPIRCD